MIQGGLRGRGAGTVERLAETGAADRLEQVVDGVQLESVDGVLVVGGAEDDVRTRLGKAGGDVDAGAAGHLDVEEEQVGLVLGGQFHGLRPGLGLGDDLDVGCAASNWRRRARAGASSSAISARMSGSFGDFEPDAGAFRGDSPN